MKYPGVFRTVFRYFPLKVNIGGRSKTIVLKLFDKLFDHTVSKQTINLDGQLLSLDISQPSERLLYYVAYNFFEHYRRSDLYFVMSEVFKEHSGLYIDIGSNLGIYAYFAKKFGAKVLLFEPEPNHFAFLVRNKHIFDKVSSYALGDSCKKAEFYVASNNPGGSSLVMSSKGWENSGYDHTTQVNVTTFDEFFKTMPLDFGQVRLIKIDVEGGEYATLIGMRSYLTRDDSAIIWCEVRGSDSDRGVNNYIDIIRYMEQFDYQAFTVENKELSPFNVATSVPSSVFDLLFMVISRHEGYFSSK